MRGEADMNDNAWNGLDPEIRAQAAAAAAELGVSLDQYLTELLLEQALETMLQEPDAAETPAEVPRTPAPIGKSPETFVIRRRLDALDRRIALAVSNLDSAINTVDGSVLSLASRVEETEAVHGEAADSLGLALNDLSENLSGVRAQLAVAEGGLSALNAANAAAHAELTEKYADLDQRLVVVDDIARDADRATSELARAAERLKQAVIEDFLAFTEGTTSRLGADLDEVRTAAVADAHHADAAAAHVMSELRTLRETVEGRLAESAAETQARVQAAFADSTQLCKVLSARVAERERTAMETDERMCARLIDIEDAAQTALEETAEGLRATHAALAVDVVRVSQDNRAGLDVLRSEMTRDIAALRDAHGGVQARLKQADSAIANAVVDISNTRHAFERQLADASATARAEWAQTRESWSGRVDVLAARLADSEGVTAHAHHIATAEINRVEACTLAALEKGAQDRAAGDAGLRRELNETAQAARTYTEDMRQRLQHDLAALRGQQAGVQARVDALAADGQAALKRLPTLEAHLTCLQAALDSAQTDAGLADLRKQVAALAARFGEIAESVSARAEDARARLIAQEDRSAQTSDRLGDLTRLLTRLSAQGADAAAQSDDRLGELERDLADLSDQAPAAALGARLANLEQRQADALDSLRADITQVLGANNRRLAALEDGDFAADFQALRQRVEERLVEAERKSVRALEQVMETVALIGRKLTGADDARAPAAKSA